jgi:hypothetical protein
LKLKIAVSCSSGTVWYGFVAKVNSKETEMFKPIMVAIGLFAASAAGAHAEPANSNAGGHQYQTRDGNSFSNPGKMFQYLRDRDNGLANGNPRDIVDAYPDEFDNVGDLIRQKHVD